jgi:hypothetical protein
MRHGRGHFHDFHENGKTAKEIPADAQASQNCCTTFPNNIREFHRSAGLAGMLRLNQRKKGPNGNIM